MRSATKPWWQQVTALVSLSTSGAITGFTFAPHAAADVVSPAGTPVHLLALEHAARPTRGNDATLRAAIVNVAKYYLRLAQTRTPAEMEALIWRQDSVDGADHGPSCAAFASLTLELAAQAVGGHSWVTGGTSYPWPLHSWADVRVDPSSGSPGIVSVLQDAAAHHRWHPLGDGYDPQPGDWVLFDGHVEVVTDYSHGVLSTIGGDSLPNFSVNAHEYPGPLSAQGVVGFVDNGETPAAAAAPARTVQHASSGQPTSDAPSVAVADIGPAIPGVSVAGSAAQAPDPPARRGNPAIPGVPADPTGPGAAAQSTAPGRQPRSDQAPARGRSTVRTGPGQRAEDRGRGAAPTLFASGASRAGGADRAARDSGHVDGTGRAGATQSVNAGGSPGANQVAGGQGSAAGYASASAEQPRTGAALIPGVLTAGSASAASQQSAAAAASAGTPASAAGSAPEGGSAPAGSASPSTRSRQRSRAAAVTAASPAADSQQAFIDRLAPAAIAAARRYGVPASVTIAQAIEESGWGQSELARSGNNLFGIKGVGPAGSTQLPTLEYENGQWVTVSASFRMYHDIGESVTDHDRLLATSGYYQQAMANRGNPDAFAAALTGVYATDPSYGAKLISLMRQYDLYRYDAAASGGSTATPSSGGGQADAMRSTAPQPAGGATGQRSAAAGTSAAPAGAGLSTAAGTAGSTRASVRGRGSTPGGATIPGVSQLSGSAPAETAAPGSAVAPATSTPTASTPTGPTPTSPTPTSGTPAGATPGTPTPTSPTPTGATPTPPASTHPGPTASPSGTETGPRTAAPEPLPTVSATAPQPGTGATPAAAGRAPALARPSAAAGHMATSGRSRAPGSAAPTPTPTPTPTRTSTATSTMSAIRSSVASPPERRGTLSGHASSMPGRYRPRIPAPVRSAILTSAYTPLTRAEPLYRDVADSHGLRWELLAACDWMQCDAHPRRSPVYGERLGRVNPDGTVFRTKSAALDQCAADLVQLALAVYGIDLTVGAVLSIRQVADVFAAFRWGGLLKRHRTSAMEFPYSVAGLTDQHLHMRWPTIAEPDAPDRPGARFRRPFGAVPLVLCLNYPVTV